jgi:hypothetical protein
MDKLWKKSAAKLDTMCMVLSSPRPAGTVASSPNLPPPAILKDVYSLSTRR